MSKIFEAFQEEKQKELEFSEREYRHLNKLVVQPIPKPELPPKGWAERVMEWVVWGEDYKEWHK
jgi:hypothetical protein